MSIFDQWTDLDPALARRRIEAAHGSAIFNKFSCLDPQYAIRQIETALGIDLDNQATDFSQLKPAIDAALSGGGGGAGYVAKAVHFDGTALLVNDALSAIDNEFFAISFWFRLSSIEGSPELFVTDPLGNYTSSFDLDSAASRMNIHLKAEIGGGTLSGLVEVASYFGGWHHFLGAADTNHELGSKIYRIYIDDVSMTPFINDEFSAFLLTFNNRAFYVGGDSYEGDSFIGDIADLWIAPGVSILTDGDIVQANRRKFISADRRPVNPSGFPSSAVLFSGDAATFATNRGTGGPFTLTGTLTDATNSPSDGVSGYVAKAVHFDGTNTSLRNEALVCVDGAITSGSFWFRIASSQDGKSLFATNIADGYNNFIVLSDFNTPKLDLGDAPDNLFCSVQPENIFDTQWHHVLYSCDTNHPAGSKILKLFLDGVDRSEGGADLTAAFKAAFNGLSFYLGEDSYGHGPVIDIADFWIEPSKSLLTGGTIAPATVAKFSANNKPVSLGANGELPTGTPPAIFFSGDAATFGNNKGSGGSFTWIGTPTNATSSPSVT